MVTADFNGDGNPDLVIAAENNGARTNAEPNWLLITTCTPCKSANGETAIEQMAQLFVDGRKRKVRERAHACLWSAQSVATNAAYSVCTITSHKLRSGRRLCFPRRPYSTVFSVHFQPTSEIRFWNQSAPRCSELYPPDIECRATQFVTAECLPLAKLPHLAAQDNSAIFDRARPRRLWKTLFSTSLLPLGSISPAGRCCRALTSSSICQNAAATLGSWRPPCRKILF